MSDPLCLYPHCGRRIIPPEDAISWQGSYKFCWMHSKELEPERHVAPKKEKASK